MKQIEIRVHCITGCEDRSDCAQCPHVKARYPRVDFTVDHHSNINDECYITTRAIEGDFDYRPRGQF